VDALKAVQATPTRINKVRPRRPILDHNHLPRRARRFSLQSTLLLKRRNRSWLKAYGEVLEVAVDQVAETVALEVVVTTATTTELTTSANAASHEAREAHHHDYR